MPWILTFGSLVRALVPVSIFDSLMSLLGANKTMDNFKGRK